MKLLELNTLLRAVQTNLAPAVEDKALTLHLQLEPQLPQVLADERSLYRAMTNLVENATYYTASGGSVTVTTRRDSADVMVEVADTGVGIEPDELPHVFDRFYRSQQAEQLRAGGTGLGLAIAKQSSMSMRARSRWKAHPASGRPSACRCLSRKRSETSG